MFRETVVPFVSDIFDVDFWNIVTLRAAYMYPAVWYASLAMASASKVAEMDATKDEVAMQLRQSYEQQALTFCSKSARHLTQVNYKNPSVADQEMLLLTCNLLIGYANLRGDKEQAMMHLANGAYLSKKWKYWETGQGAPLQHRLKDCVAPVLSINLLFRRLEMQLYNSFQQLPKDQVVEMEDSIPTDLTPFTSATEAYMHLLPIQRELRMLMRLPPPRPGAIAISFMAPGCEQWRQPFQDWRTKLHLYGAQLAEKEKIGCVPGDEKIRMEILHIWELCFETSLYVDMLKGPLGWDDFNTNFINIADTCEKLLEQHRNERLRGNTDAAVANLSCFMSLVSQPLTFVASTCRIPSVRRRALQLVKEHPFRDGVAAGADFITLFERKIEFEEQAAKLAPLEGGCDCGSNIFVCNSHRVPTGIVEFRPDGSMFAEMRTVHDEAMNQLGKMIPLVPPTNTMDEKIT